MTTFVIAHGAWSAGWAWARMHPLLSARGHALVVPTLTGLGERRHLLHPMIDLETHIADVLAVLEVADLADVVLIGHSYGGMVATGVADRARDRIRRLVYLDAMVPDDGESLFDLVSAEGGQAMRARAKREGDGWLIPPNELPPDTVAADVAWITPRRFSQPIRTFERRLELRHGALDLPRCYLYCTRIGPGDVFGPMAARARAAAWPVTEIDASHSPHITAPEVLADLMRSLS